MGDQRSINQQGINIWSSSSDEKHRSGWFYIAVVLILLVLGFIAGAFGSLSFSIDNPNSLISFGSGVNYFWSGITVQQIGSIWFGAWGILAGVIFPFFSNAVVQTPFLISFAYIPANFLQGFFPAYIFRRLRVDPRLQSGIDYLYLFVSMVAGNLIGAVWSVFALIYIFGIISWGDAVDYFFGWFGGNMIAGIVFNFVLLKALSSVIIRSNSLVKKWWI